VLGEEIPSVTAFVDDFSMGVEDGYGELVGSEKLPDIFDRVELGCVVRQGGEA
jgi:hypothetical protein